MYTFSIMNRSVILLSLKVTETKYSDNCIFMPHFFTMWSKVDLFRKFNFVTSPIHKYRVTKIITHKKLQKSITCSCLYFVRILRKLRISAENLKNGMPVRLNFKLWASHVSPSEMLKKSCGTQPIFDQLEQTN